MLILINIRMKRVYFTNDYHHDAHLTVSVSYCAGFELELEDDIANMAVLRGCAVFSDFAEDDLFDEMETPTILPMSDEADEAE